MLLLLSVLHHLVLGLLVWLLVLFLLSVLHHFILGLLVSWLGVVVGGLLRNYRRLGMGRPGADIASAENLLRWS